MSVTVNDTVDDPACPLFGSRVAVQVNVSAPQPALIEMPEFAKTAALLLLTVTVSAPDPLSVKAIGAGELGEVTD